MLLQLVPVLSLLLSSLHIFIITLHTYNNNNNNNNNNNKCVGVCSTLRQRWNFPAEHWHPTSNHIVSHPRRLQVARTSNLNFMIAVKVQLMHIQLPLYSPFVLLAVVTYYTWLQRRRWLEVYDITCTSIMLQAYPITLPARFLLLLWERITLLKHQRCVLVVSIPARTDWKPVLTCEQYTKGMYTGCLFLQCLGTTSRLFCLLFLMMLLRHIST